VESCEKEEISAVVVAVVKMGAEEWEASCNVLDQESYMNQQGGRPL